MDVPLDHRGVGEGSGQHDVTGTTDGAPAVDPVDVIRSKPYLTALVLAAIAGIPVSVIAHCFRALVAEVPQAVFETLPNQLFGSPPAWLPLP